MYAIVKTIMRGIALVKYQCKGNVPYSLDLFS